MSHLSDILDGAENSIRASSTFADGNIFRRAEMVDDEMPDDVSVYLIAGDPKAKEQSNGEVFSICPLTVLIVFNEPLVPVAEGQRDVVMERKAEYAEAMRTALLLNMPNSTYLIDNIYQVDYLDTVYNPPASAENAKKENSQRLIQHWNYHAYES